MTLNDLSRVMGIPAICKCETKDADHRAADQCFVFAAKIVQSHYFKKSKSQAPGQFLGLFSSVCVGHGRKPRKQVISINSYLFTVTVRSIHFLLDVQLRLRFCSRGST